MKVVNMNVKPYGMLSIRSYKSIQTVNEHGYIEISGLIYAGQESEFIQKASGETWIEIWAADEGGQNFPLFHGILDQLRFESHRDGCMMYMKAGTGTMLMDYELHTRSFQKKI